MAATVTAPDPAAVVAAWTEVLGYRYVGEGTVSEALASSWGAPGEAGSEYALLEPTSGADFALRVVASDPWPDHATPDTTFGWAALELTVQDVDALYEAIEADGRLTVIGRPAAVGDLAAIYPMQVCDPAGVVVYLNEVRADLANVDLPRATCPVDHAFIAVLGAPDLEAAVGDYARRLGFEPANRYEIAYGVINRAFGLEPEERHRLVTTRVGRRVLVEIDQYPRAARPRKAHLGRLPPGIAMITFGFDDGPTMRGIGPGYHGVEAPYRGARSTVILGPAGERIEVVAR